ncbi:MAG TPA: hypothetical protein VJU86_00425 [Pyrinomonadaceae bacterium]|nr:hypothetical protein [Pyrinomonadaceae bacterium]
MKKKAEKPQRRTQVKKQSPKEKALSKGELKSVRGGAKISKVEAINIKQTVVSDSVGME